MNKLHFLLITAALSLAACGEKDHGHTMPAECEALSSACHESTTTLGIECHENGHGVWTAEQCIAMEASCLAECATGVDAGPTGTDSGPTGTDSGPIGTDSGPTGTDSGPAEDAGVDAGA